MRRNVSPSRPFKQTQAPVAKGTRYSRRPYKMQMRGENVIIKHTEYIGDITSPNPSFNVTAFSINPGIQGTFPWLANIAPNYESYKFHKLEFEYKPMCPTNTAGVVSMAVDYDAADQNPTSKIVMKNYESTVSSSVWDSCLFRSKSSNLLKFGVQRYTRTAPLAANLDIKTYDVGRLFVATSNTPTIATPCGELYCHYEIELFTPQLGQTSAVAQDQSNSPSTPVVQYTKLVVAAGVASLTAEIFGRPMLKIVKQAIETVGGVPYSIVDLQLNPLISKAIRFEARIPNAAEIGRAWANSVLTAPFVGFATQTLGPPVARISPFWFQRLVTPYSDGLQYKTETFITPGTVPQGNSTFDYQYAPVIRLKLPTSAETLIVTTELESTPPLLVVYDQTVLGIGMPPPLATDPAVILNWLS